MGKKRTLYILLDLIFLVVFNVVFFVVGGAEHSASVWISYGFIHFAYLMLLATRFLVRESSSAYVFGFALYSISSVYFAIQFVVGLIFVIANSNSYKVPLVVQVIIAGIYAIILLSNLIANEHTADSIEKHMDEVGYIKSVSSRIKILVGKAADKKANAEIEKIYDLIHSSPTHSIEIVKPIEKQINKKVSELERAVSANSTGEIISIVNEITSMVEKRNSKLRI